MFYQSIKHRKSVFHCLARVKSISSGANLGKILTVLLTTVRRRRKNLGGCGGMPPGNFFNFNCLKCPLLASGVNRTLYLQVAFVLDGALQTYELFHQSQCPCCNECAARQVLSILSVTSCIVNVFSRLQADTFLSHSHVVTGRVEKF